MGPPKAASPADCSSRVCTCEQLGSPLACQVKLINHAHQQKSDAAEAPPPLAARRIRDFRKILEHRYPPHGHLPPTDLGRRFARVYVDHQILLENGVTAARNFLERCCGWMIEDEREEIIHAALAVAPWHWDAQKVAVAIELPYAERTSIRWQEKRTRKKDGKTWWQWQSIGSIAATDADMEECKRRTNERRTVAQAEKRRLEAAQRKAEQNAAAADAKLRGRILAVYETIGPNWIRNNGLATKLKRMFGKIKKKSVVQQINKYCRRLIDLGLIEGRKVPGANNLNAWEVRRPR